MKPKSSREPDNADISRLIAITRSAHAKNRRRSFLATAALCLGIVLTGFLAITALEQQAYLLPVFKISLFGLLLLAVVGLAAWRVRTSSGESFNEFYIRFARYANLPSLKDAFDLTLSHRNSDLRLFDAALSQNIHQLDETDIRQKLKSFLQKQHAFKRFKFTTAFMSVALAGIFVTGWLLPDAAMRVLHMWNRYEAPNPYTYTVEPGDITIEQGNTLAPFVIFEGDHPNELTLRFKTDAEEEYRSRPILRSNRDTVFFNSVNLNSSSSYYFTMDGFQSRHYRANVQLPPRFESLNARIIAPEYTDLDTTSYEYPFSSLKAYQGSQIVLNGTVNKQLSYLTLIRSEAKGDSTTLIPDPANRFSDTLSVNQIDTVSFGMRDTSGLANNNPFEFIVEPREDEVPMVTILEPETDLEMKNPQDLAVTYEATDDFGLTSSRLRYEIRRAFAESPTEESIQLATPTLNRRMDYTWKLEDLDPRPRDVITFWIQVTDNNEYKGPQTAVSRKLTITFPSLTSYLDELENKERNVDETLKDISESHQQLRQEYDHFKENLRQNPEGNWEQQQTLDEVKEQHEQLNKKVEELNKKFKEIRQEMQNSDIMSDETLKAYDELQDLMKEIDDPELLKALEQLQNSMSEMDQQQLKEALENFEFNEQQYQERINRTIELFKTLKMNSDLEKNAAALEELARQEKELSESEDSSGNRVEKQKAVQEDTQKLSDELQNLSKNAPERSKKDVSQLEQESIHKMKDIRKQLDDNIRKMQESSEEVEQSKEIQNQQQQIQQDFQQMAQQMRSARKQLGQQQNQINMAALRYILYSLINLSQNQEELTRTTEQLSSRSQAFVEQARIQRTIADHFTLLSDSLFKVSAEIPSFSNKINEKKMTIGKHLDSSVKLLAERDRSQSTFASRQSLAGFNELSSMLATLLDQLQNQQQEGGGSGMSMQQLMEQLQQMSGQQQEMNRRIDELINDIQGDRLSNEQIDRLNQLARQQNRIREQIKELQENGGLESGDKVLSELERLSEEMEETINDLRGGQTDESLVKRQQNILSRMLSAEKALDERGEDEKREGTSAEESPRSTPPDVTLEDLEKNIRKLLNDPQQTRFSQDYQRLIEQYFQLLRDLEKKES